MIGMIIKQVGARKSSASCSSRRQSVAAQDGIKYLIWRFFSLKLATCRLGITGVTSEGEFLHLPYVLKILLMKGG